MTKREYNAGDIILKEGDPSDFAYVAKRLKVII